VRGLRIFLIVVLLQASSAFAEIYRWVDEAGGLHFSQSLQQVPQQFRAQVRNAGPAKNSGNFQTYSARVEPSTASSLKTHRIPFRYDGSLMRVDATVNDTVNIPFYIDTGASGVSLPARFAAQLGITVGPDTQWVTVWTANGKIRVPMIKLDSVVVGTARVDGLMATLNPTTKIGLLGGAFFNNYKYQVDPSRSVMTLEPNHNVPPKMNEGYWRGRFGKLQNSLNELDAYLGKYGEGLHANRRDELEAKRENIRAALEGLQLEANRDNVPRAWRQ
jgi:clan AA aspartic protease (TIGR02281 family)